MIARFSVFSPNPWGDGGARRSAQISELLGRTGRESTMIGFPVEARRSLSLAGLIGEAAFLVRCGVPFSLRADVLFTLGNDLRFFRKCLRQFQPGTLFLWEATHSRFACLPFLAKEYGHCVVGLPHNLESLVPANRSFYTNKVAPRWLPEEMRALAACDHVFAISREDQWLLRLHGVNAEFLPYTPPQQVAEAMMKIRSSREDIEQGRDLILLGTAANRPTYLGLLDRLEFFARHAHSFGTLHVVGYGTERLRNVLPNGMNVVLHGEVDFEQLRRLLCIVRAAIVHQVPTSGALTRIPELLMAGVPVLANVDAARSFFGAHGVAVYESDEHLLEMLEGGLDMFGLPASCPHGVLEFLRFVKDH